MPTPTYDLIEEKTPSGVSQVTFSSIPQTYTHLVIEFIGSDNYGSDDNLGFQFGNGSVDTGSNYSWTRIYGTGTSAISNRSTSQTVIGQAALSGDSTKPSTIYAHLMSYTNTNVNKTMLYRSDSSAAYVGASVGLWRSTAAVNTIKLFTYVTSATFNSGTSIRLWGVSG